MKTKSVAWAVRGRGIASPWRAARALGVIAIGLALSGLSCGDDGDCSDGVCVCGDGESCEFECEAPPCHVECVGDNASCLGECGNGSCECGSGSNCSFGCHSPPCHVDCTGNSCSGVCANGTCHCETGTSCAFECSAGPCHVECDGDNERCDGTCANGTCSCGPGSDCTFECLDDNCDINCSAGASCLLACPAGNAGSGCEFNECAAGEPEVCPGGELVACGRACPEAD